MALACELINAPIASPLNMLTHIVCWKYREEISDDVREQHRAKLRGLKNVIPEVIDMRVGADVLHLERSYHTGLVATFADETALEAYTIHPQHQEVASMGRDISVNVISVDFIATD
jgi:hypothetical protein